jgi:hypothetical protein
MPKQTKIKDMSKEEVKVAEVFSDDVENEQVLLDEEQFDKLIEVLSIIDEVRDSIDDLADGRQGEVSMFKLSYELGKAHGLLCRAYKVLDAVTDELNPALAMEDDEEDDQNQ